MSRRANRQDDNQAEIDSFLRRAGAVVVPMHPEAGFDRLVAYNGSLFVIEVKSPTGRLTENERFRQAQFESVGVRYHVVRNTGEAMEAIQ